MHTFARKPEKSCSFQPTLGHEKIVHQALSSPGQSLDVATRQYLEPRFAHDFSRVRVHTDATAARSAEAVDARAYTVGRDVVFGPGAYQPGTDDGRRLIVHELTHVVQQTQGSAGPSPVGIAVTPVQLARSPAPPKGGGSAADLADLQRIMLKLFEMLSPELRAQIIGYKTIAVGIARQGTFRTLLYAANNNWTDPELAAAAEKLGLHRADPRPELEGKRNVTGGATDAEQLLTAHSDAQGLELEAAAVSRPVCKWCRVALRFYRKGKVRIIEVPIPSELVPAPATGAGAEVAPEQKRSTTSKGRGRWKGTGGKVGGIIAPFFLGWAHLNALPSRLEKLAKEKGFAAPGEYSGGFWARLADKVGDVLYDPTLEAQRSVSLRSRLNVPVWRRRVRAYFSGKIPGDRLTFTWYGKKDDVELTYTLSRDGRWIESKHHDDIIDINMVLSPEVSDEAILNWLSPPSPTCIVDGEEVPCA